MCPWMLYIHLFYDIQLDNLYYKVMMPQIDVMPFYQLTTQNEYFLTSLKQVKN